MPWERRTVYQQREDFVQAAAVCSNFSALCREFGISRRTGYKWLTRSQAGLPLTDQSRRPATSPGKTPADVEQLILAVRTENPGWGAKTIRHVLERQGCAGQLSITSSTGTAVSVKVNLSNESPSKGLRWTFATQCGRPTSKVSFAWPTVTTAIL